MIKTVKFADCDLNNEIFDSLIEDYPEFRVWFERKSNEGAEATIVEKDDEIEAFVYLKNEKESIELIDETLPEIDRIKIGTFKTTSTLKGKRYGEGLIGNILRIWGESDKDEIYVTTFPKQTALIGMLTAYGFELKGELYGGDGELMYSRNKSAINFETPKMSFPFVKSDSVGKYLLIEEEYHDTLFPQSTLARGMNEARDLDVKNGVTKMYVSSIYNYNSLKKGDFMVIYRKSNNSPARYHAVATGVVVVEQIEIIKSFGKCKISFEDLQNRLGNKTALSTEELEDYYYKSKNCSVLTVVYNQYFGAGNNVNLEALIENSLWTDEYPAKKDLSTDDLAKILELGGINEKNVVVN